MKDFNFFSPYLLEKRNRRLKASFIVSASLLLIIGVLSYSALNYYQISRYKSEISNIESFISSKNTISQLAEYQTTTQRLELTESYYKKAEEADKALRGYNNIDTKLLDELSSIMPQNSAIINLVISNNKIEISYSLNDLVTAAELEHNLKSLDIFNEIHVGVINKQAGYTADISGTLKDVNDGEAKTDK